MLKLYPKFIFSAWIALKVILTAAVLMLISYGLPYAFIVFVLLNILADSILYGMCRHYFLTIEKTLRKYITSKDTRVLGDRRLYVSEVVESFMKFIVLRLNNNLQITESKKEAQYLALQNQINPHFLYNTLETIRSEAVLKGVDSVAAMTEALATFFRYTISNLDSLVMIEDELNNVENYLIIQHYRFGEKIAFKFEYDKNEPELLQLYVPKLILQPIVENAIYHGLEEKLGAGQVIIKVVRTEKRLLITVVDNGIGMESEELRKINYRLRHVEDNIGGNSKPNMGGIAITNVNNRIKLLFGDGYGLYFRSIRNLGTDVHISLPVIQSNSLRDNKNV